MRQLEHGFPQFIALISSSGADGRSGRGVLGVRDADEHAANAFAVGDSRGLTAQRRDGLAEVVGKDLHIRPGYLAAPAGTDHFEDRFLGGPPSGDEGYGVFVDLAPLLFERGEHAIEESLPVVLEDSLDACALDKIDPVGDDGHAGHGTAGIATRQSSETRHRQDVRI